MIRLLQLQQVGGIMCLRRRAVGVMLKVAGKVAVESGEMDRNGGVYYKPMIWAEITLSLVRYGSFNG